MKFSHYIIKEIKENIDVRKMYNENPLFHSFVSSFATEEKDENKIILDFLLKLSEIKLFYNHK